MQPTKIPKDHELHTSPEFQSHLAAVTHGLPTTVSTQLRDLRPSLAWREPHSPLLYPPSTPEPVQPPRMSLVHSPALLGCESLETESSCCSFSPWQLASGRCSPCPNEWKIQFIFCLRGLKETFYISFPISFFWLHPDGKCNEMQKMEVMWQRVINASSGIP